MTAITRKKTAKRKERESAAAASSTMPVAVIDIGTTSVRMIVAQADGQGGIRTLDFLHQAVSLGKDTFTRGNIARSSIEECVQALRSFRKLLEEYQITDDKRIRAVATTAVREAANIDAFIDRIAIATGISVEPIDEVEVARLTYLSFHASLHHLPRLARADVVIAEVGGGSTELLFLENGVVAFSKTYRLGTMRMREMLEEFHAPAGRQRAILQSHIQQTIKAIRQSITPSAALNLIALGSDARFAAAQILDNYDPDRPTALGVKDLAAFTEDTLQQSPNELVRRYHLPFPDAETVGQALLFYVNLAKSFGTKEILLTNISMRHGLLLELLGHATWTRDFRGQIMHSALEIARKYEADTAHAKHVAHLCELLFDALAEEHRLGPRWRLFLGVAGLLHDIGSFVSARSHHKHSMYLIQNSELFGLGAHDVLLVALIARYHRRASPKPTHVGYAGLERRERQAVAKAAAILRVADALDRSYSQRIRTVSCAIEENRFVVTTRGTVDLSLEQLALKNKGPLFEEVYGLGVVLRNARAGAE
ncbi:MAG: HD domain-containing protein [Chitinivibrionales bacterium]|nr:HD domain-containing protein [Chitinivibrionales bacterium]MBD3396289.1 HD domain-containing protein [Chitinivibrionales bacterium]